MQSILKRLSRTVTAAALITTGALALAEPASAVTPDRSVFTAGTAQDHGSTGAMPLNGPLVDIVTTATGRGYWLLGSDGGAFAYGDAPFHGSTGDLVLNRPAISMSPTRSGGGYWFVASDGGIFAFGDAGFYGSTGDIALNKPIIGMAPTASGQGYHLVASDGGVFAFGDAGFLGSLGGQRLEAPIVAMAQLPDGRGYWLLDQEGGLHPFGTAQVLSGEYSWQSDDPAVDIRSTPTGRGYWILFAGGRVANYGDATSLRPTVEFGVGQAAVGLASTPDGRGLWVATSGVRRIPDASRASGPHAFLQTDRLGRHARWNPCAAIHWSYNPAWSPDAAGGEQMFKEAFAYVGAITGLSFHYDGMTNVAPGISPFQSLHDFLSGGSSTSKTMVVGWSPNISMPGADGVADTTITSTARGPRISAASITLNAAASHAKRVGWGGGSWGLTVLHEIGHAIGLDHIEADGQMMHPYGGGALDFGQGDLAGLHVVGASRGCF